MDVWDAFGRTVEAYPDKEAIVDAARRLTFQELRATAERCAAGLASLGVQPADRVLVIAENGLRHCVVTLACQALHAMSTHVVPRLKPAEAQAFIEDADPRVILASVDVVAPLPTVRLDDDEAWERLLADSGALRLPEPDESAPSNMMYTSGTTGLPKGVPLAHRQTYGRAIAGAIHTGIRADDRVLGVMPLFHQMGMIGNFLLAMVVGATYFPLPRLQTSVVLDLIENERLTAFFGSPTHWAMLAADPSLPGRDLTSFTKGAYGGGALRLNQVEFWNERLQSELLHVYGTSETMWTLLNPHTRTRPAVTGRPGLHHRLRVVEIGAHSPDAVVPDGDEGELIVYVAGEGAGEECFASYWRKPDATADAIVGGWYFTGDSARRDVEGDYTITGRIKSIIRSGAEWVHPEEVERVLAEHAAISDVAVVGVPDPVWGEVVSALVVRRSDVTAEDVDRYCREHPQLAAYKRPRRIAFVETIPRNVSGKLVRADAVAVFERQAEVSSS